MDNRNIIYWALGVVVIIILLIVVVNIFRASRVAVVAPPTQSPVALFSPKPPSIQSGTEGSPLPTVTPTEAPLVPPQGNLAGKLTGGITTLVSMENTGSYLATVETTDNRNYNLDIPTKASVYDVNGKLVNRSYLRVGQMIQAVIVPAEGGFEARSVNVQG